MLRICKSIGVFVAALLAAACGSSNPVSGSSSTPTSPTPAVAPFEAISLEKIALPATIVSASIPAWTNDGRHLLFTGSTDGRTGHLYIVAEDGSGLLCLSCGVANEPSVQADGGALSYALPDGKRVFFGPYGTFTILECTPSLLNCQSAQILPIDISAARPSVTGIVDIGGGAAPHMAPDGIHLVFSDVRSDAAELMVMGTLVRQADKYVLTDPRVINPPGPSGPLDRSPIGWSNGGQLYEFKSFADGGASATYVGFPESGNPDVIKVNLATGATTRLTTQPDWDEDNAPSPDGTSIVVESDRGMHRTDMFGLMPVRSLIDTPLISALAIYYVGSPERRQCDLQPWLLPAAGDAGASLMGQPLNPYNGGDVHAANNISGMPQWSPDGTKVALGLMSYTTAMGPPYLLVAHLRARKPSIPIATVSSAPGTWALSPNDFHGSIQSNQPVLVKGLASGSALVVYTGLGVLGGVDSVIYNHYSDDGKNFVDGTDTIVDGLILEAALEGSVTWTSHLTLSGEHTGSRDGALTFVIPSGSGNAGDTGAVVSGSSTTTYDGASFTGPPAVPMACPQALPRPQPLAFTTSVSGGQLVVNVTSTVYGAGRDEEQTDTRPVWGATVTFNGRSVVTDPSGDAAFSTSGANGATLSVTAGDTMVPTSGVVHLP